MNSARREWVTALIKAGPDEVALLWVPIWQLCNTEEDIDWLCEAFKEAQATDPPRWDRLYEAWVRSPAEIITASSRGASWSEVLQGQIRFTEQLAKAKEHGED